MLFWCLVQDFFYCFVVHVFFELRERVYRTAGGAPHLDGSYTVFGEVIGGMGRVVRISKLPTDSQDRPKNEDVYIKSMTVKVVKDRRRDR